MKFSDKSIASNTTAPSTTAKSMVPTTDDAIIVTSSKVYTGKKSRFYKPSQGNPTKEMDNRLQKLLQRNIPNVDMVDFTAELTLDNSVRR